MTERTPAGGDRSEITFLDASGNVLPDERGAAEVKICEYAGDIMIRRYYMEIAPADRIPTWTPPGDTPDEPHAADTTKLSTWDIYDSDNGILRLATTTDSLLHAVGLAGADEAEQRRFLANMLTMPAWNAAPDELKQDVTHWLARH